MSPIKSDSTNVDYEVAGDAKDDRTMTPPKARQPRRLDRWLSLVILACGLLTILVGIYLVVASWNPVPMWDEWQEIDAIAKAPNHSPPLLWLWSQHSEHRILLYRLLLLADVKLFHGRHWISFASIIAVQCGFLALIVWLLRREPMDRALFWSVAGLAAFCLFCPSQWENLFWAIQIVVFLPGFLCLVAILGLLEYQRSISASSPKRWSYLVLSILAASGATYSFGNGIVVWPVLVLVAALMRFGVRVLFVYLVSGAAVVGSYLFHYVQPNPQLSPLLSIRHPLEVLEYVAKALGVVLPPWMRIRDLVAVSTGALGLAAALAITVWFLMRDRRRTPLTVTLLALMFYSLATALLNALGRRGLGIDQAYQSRYQTINLLFWFCLITLWLLVVDQAVPLMRTSILLVVSLGMVTAAGVLFPLCLRAAHILTLRSEAAALALVTKVPDSQALALLYPDPSVPWRDAEYLREQRLFMFSGSWYGHMEEPLDSAYRMVSRDHCAGQVERVEFLPAVESLTGAASGGVRLSGWAVIQPSGDPAPSVVIVTDGNIVGYGVGNLLSRTSGSKTFLKNAKFIQWSGFARPALGATRLDFYAVTDVRDEVCPLASLDLPPR